MVIEMMIILHVMTLGQENTYVHAYKYSAPYHASYQIIHVVMWHN